MKNRVEKIGRHTLILGDMREVVPNLQSFGLAPPDILLTDAPYPVTRGGRGLDGPKRGGWMKDYDNSGALVTGHDIGWSNWLPLAYDALGPRAHAYIMASYREVFPAFNAAVIAGNRYDAEGNLTREAGFDLHNLLPWDKGTALPNRWYQQTCEFVLFMKKGKAYPIAHPSTKAYLRLPARDETDHKTEKPVPLMEAYIRNSTKPGGVVLEPFMGSGSTNVAACRLGRGSIGVEIEEGWFDVACRRVEAAEKWRASQEFTLGDLLDETVTVDIFHQDVDGDDV